MRAKSSILVLMAVACGLVAAVGINQYMKRPAPEGTVGETTPIFVAKEQIGMGDPLKPEVLRLEAWPTDKVPPGAITKLEDTDGRRTRAIIFPGEPIIEPKLLGKGENAASPTDMIPKGHRVVSIRVDAVSGAASLIKPGDRVDVLVHVQKDAMRGITKTSTQTFLQHVKVFAVDDVFRRDVDGGATVAAKTVSLLVTPPQAELVMLATEMGTVRLVMRSANDEEDADTSPKTLNDLGSGIADGPEKSPSGASGPSGSPANPLGALAGPPKQAEPAVEPPPPVALPPVQDPAVDQPPKNVFKMVILEGDVRREVEFEDGMPVGDNGGTDGSNSGTSDAGSSPDAGASNVGAPPAVSHNERPLLPGQIRDSNVPPTTRIRDSGSDKP